MNSPRGELQERDFIREAKLKNPVPIWLWMLIILAVVALTMSLVNQIQEKVHAKVGASPFLRVTNRDISLFLWKYPEHMRLHQKRKTGYLPGFPTRDKVNPKLETVDDNVSAPPEVLFLYHTWRRLLYPYSTPRPISTTEFKEFLEYAKEWDPKKWAKAPEEYQQLVADLDLLQIKNLGSLPNETFPHDVRLAFFGWKNSMIEWNKIKTTKITAGEMTEFLTQYPHYSRNYWRNLYPEYLESLHGESVEPEAVISENEVPIFLQIAFYNFKQSR